MIVTFKKTHERGYSVTVEGPGIGKVAMDPAPGYHPRLPHDAAHFIVEYELGIAGAVFGQLAGGGSANTFYSQDARKQRKTRKRGKKISKANKQDALFSEHAIYAAQSRWEKHDIIPDTKIEPAVITRIIERFQAFAVEWSQLSVGESISLEWKQPAKKR